MAAEGPTPAPPPRRTVVAPPRPVLPALLATAAGMAYLAWSPPSPDLAAQLFRVRLFGAEGFASWDNWWFAGHTVPGYSVLFPPLGWVLGARVLGVLAAIACATLFADLAHRHFGRLGCLGAAWFALGTVTELLSGRLTFLLGLAPALGAAAALGRRRPFLAATAAGLAALTSPVAALVAATAGAAVALAGPRKRDGLATAVGALAPTLALSLVFPQGGHEPFALSALWPIAPIAAVLLAFTPPRHRALRAAIALYAGGCLLAYAIPTPLGGNAARIVALAAGPLVALVLRESRARWLAAAALPLLYLQWQGAVRDTLELASDPSTTAAYYRPLLVFLDRRSRPTFRVEIPPTRSHWEALEVAPRFPLARGWERQTDIGDDGLFYRPQLSAAAYDRWLHRLAVRFVALPDVPLDGAAAGEATLLRRRQPFLTRVLRTPHWQVFAVREATPLAEGAARVTSLGPGSVTLRATGSGTALVRVRYTPLWRLEPQDGCVSDQAGLTRLTLRRPGPLRMVAAWPWSAAGACR